MLHLGQRWFTAGSTLESTLTLADELGRPGRAAGDQLRRPSATAMRSAFEARGHRVFADLQFYEWAALFERARAS